MTHQILPGSLQVDGTTVTAGVHVGPTEWDIKGLRYVSADIKEGQPGDTVLTILGRKYDTTDENLLKA